MESVVSSRNPPRSRPSRDAWNPPPSGGGGRQNPQMLALPITGAVSFAAVVSAGYQSMAPTGHWYGKRFPDLLRGSRQLPLTYDDAPNDPQSVRLPHALASHNVQATFF